MKNSVWMFGMISVLITGMAVAESVKTHPRTDVYEGWKIGPQAWSFNRFTFFEAIDKTRSLGLDYIQAYPGQRISDEVTVGFGPEISAEQKKAVKEKLAEANVQIVSFGVTGVPNDEAGARKLFAFAVEMGIGTIVSEPAMDQFDMLDKLCQEYKVKLAIHNHPKPSPYWNPDTVLKACEGRSPWIGACTDTGHWVRSGLEPLDCLKKLEGRIVDVHIKEIEDGHDVVWGTGQGRMKGLLEELHRQNFQGTFAIEYEYNWENNLPEIRQSVEYFNQIASGLKPTGWKRVFKEDLSNATFKPNSWAYENGELARKGEGDLWTGAKYSNYILDFEFKLAKDTNSGIFLRAAEQTWLPWVEVQVEDSFGKPVSRHICGGIYDIKEPTVNAVKAAGQWNRMTITASGPQIGVILNGQAVLDVNLNDWTQAGKNPDGSNNKFTDIAYKDLPREGWIGFQDHGYPVWYRNVKIKEL
jgi:sugar phosphate isomerase/epimerase